MGQENDEFRGRRRRGQYREYEPHVRELIALSGKWNLFPDLGSPRNTAESWIEKGYQGLDDKLNSFANHYLSLNEQVERLQREAFLLTARVKLMAEMQKALGAELNTKKIRSPEIRSKLLAVIEQAIQEKVPRSVCLSTLGLTRSRYKRWRRQAKRCPSNPTHACFRLSISQLTPKEIRTMRYYVTSKKFNHFPVKSLFLLARKNRKLLCAYSTWLKYVHAMGWLRPKRRKKPKAKRKEGVRAKRPNENGISMSRGSSCLTEAKSMFRRSSIIFLDLFSPGM